MSKSLRSVVKIISFMKDSEIKEALIKADDNRLFVIAEALRRGWSVAEVHQITEISTFFLPSILRFRFSKLR